MAGMNIAEKCRTKKLKAEGDAMIRSVCERFKSKDNDLYEKNHKQIKKEGRVQHKSYVEICNRVKAREDKKRIQAEEKKPKTLEEKLKTVWDSKPELKKEFGNNYDSYEAYFMNDKEFQAAGNVTCFDSKKVALFPKPTATQTAKEIWDSDPQLRTEFNHNFKAYELYVRS